jgi:6-phosphogluconolactonase
MVPLPLRNLHPVQGEAEPGAAALAYEEEVRSFFGGMPRFNLMLLGVGADGHTASLFPGSAALRERTRLALPVYLEPPGISRVTLTLPVLNNALQVLFLVVGESKAGIVHEILEDGNPQGYPAGLVCPASGSLTWMVDHEAAAALTSPEAFGVSVRRRKRQV